MTHPSNASTNNSFGSPKSLRYLGNAIALAAFTGLLAYGCEKSRDQATPATPTPAKAPAASPPAPVETPKPATPAPATPAKEPPKAEPVQSDPPPTLVPPKPGEFKASVPIEPGAPEGPKAKPIPHDELAKDVKPLSSFTTPTNVIVEDIKKGEGFPTLPKAVVTMHFVLRLQDGWKKIQSTWEDGAPETYQLDEIVLGMADGVIGMQPGATRRLIVPPARGFGEKGVKNKNGEVVIPPNATLVYDIDLISNKQKVVEIPKALPAIPKFDAGRKDESGK
jgi:hypothetical protein